MESGALGVEIGMSEGEHAGAAPWDPEEQRGEGRRGGGKGEEKILPFHAGEDEQHGGDSADDEGSAEVGLLDDQQHKYDGHERGLGQRVAPVAHLVEARGEEPGEKQNDDRLGDLRGLKRESSEADPAMGMVGVAEEEHHDEKHGGDGERGIDELGRVVAFVIDAREHEHGGEAGKRPERLADEEAVGGVIALLGHDGGGGKDHDKADDHQ